MDSISLTTSLSSDHMNFSRDFSSNIQLRVKQKLIESAINKENFLSSNQDYSLHSATTHFRSKSLNHNFNKIQKNGDSFQTKFNQEKAKNCKNFDLSPTINKKKTHCKINSCTIQELSNVKKAAETIRSSASNSSRRKSLNWSCEEKANIMLKKSSIASNENQKRQKNVSSLKPKNISATNKSKNNQDWHEISGCIIYLLCEVDPKIKISTESHIKKEMQNYFNELNHIIQMLKKLPRIIKEKRLSESNKYIANIKKSYEYFLKADLSNLPTDPKTSEIIKLLKGIFTFYRFGEDNKKENQVDELEESQNKHFQEIIATNNSERELIGKDNLEQEKIAVNYAETIIQDKYEQDNIENVQIEEIRGNENQSTPKDLNQVEEINEHMETDTTNLLPIEDSSSGENPLKCPYIYYDESSFSSIEWSENFRSLSRLSTDSNTSKSSLLQRFYKKSGYIAKEPQFLCEHSTTPEIPELANENNTQNFSPEFNSRQSPIRNILEPSNKQLSVSPSPYKSLSVRPKTAQITPMKNYNIHETTKKSSEFNKRVEEKNKFKTEAKCNKILEDKFQFFLQRKLKEDKSQKNSQFQKKHNWVSEFKNCIETIDVGKEFEKEVITKVKTSFISHLSDRLYNRILMKAQKYIEEEQNRYAFDLEIQEAQADIAKEKQKFQDVLSKYYK